MKFELPGLTFGPADSLIEHIQRHRLTIRVAADPGAEEAQAAALGLSVEAFRRLRASFDVLPQR
ncbi:hypothetical protein [Deinococcus frigens]|uniref:hypothetical protein n=1 Tax=Deinococcus frigens TaxID=249403 RepID=UPI000495E0AF|nr:hypothetical protein [Deinococcus frigens]